MVKEHGSKCECPYCSMQYHESKNSSIECIIKGCTNKRHEGNFIGDLCAPCHKILTTGELVPSKAFFVIKIARLSDALRKFPDNFILDHGGDCDFGWWDKICNCGMDERVTNYIEKALVEEDK